MNAPTKIKQTRKVMRGLVVMAGLINDGLDPNKAPLETLVRQLSRDQAKDFDQAMKWLAQEEEALKETAEEALVEEPAETGGAS